MISIDWAELTTGLVIGSAISATYFAGLAFGIRIALGAARPSATLMLSAVLRISLLLAAGWTVAQTGTWAFVGYALAFLFVRLVVVTLANRTPTERTRWN
jgi:hypothetical protein